MEGTQAVAAVGLLLVNGTNCLPQQLRHFLESSQSSRPADGAQEPPECIKFHILPASNVAAAMQQGAIDRPALWVDEQEAATGTAALNMSYFLGTEPQALTLPIKPLKLQPIRNITDKTAVFRAYVISKVHLQLYRLVNTLFPTLERWDADLRAGGVVITNENSPATTAVLHAEQVRATVTEDGGLLLDLYNAQTGITSRGRVAINFRSACLELQTVDASGDGMTQTSASRCLRTLNSLEEAVAALQMQTTEELPQMASRISPSKVVPSDMRSTLAFQSPSKPPRRASRVKDLVKEGVSLVQACSSAQLREGATMLQTASVAKGGAASGIDAGAMEALVAAASTILPSTIMGTTEQLTVLALTIAALLDGDSSGGGKGQGVIRLVASLARKLETACANPVLLCKLLVALLQRPDVRLEAIQQGLWTTVSSTYLRKSPLLEPLAAALLSPSVMSSAGKHRSTQASSSEASSQATPLDGRSPLLTAATPRAGKLSIPRLMLPSEGDGAGQASNPSGGLTRATRRELSATPTDWHPPAAPWGSPRTATAKDASALSEMEVLAEALGESLMAMDLPSAVSHKRRADLVRDSESEAGSIPPELLEGPMITARQQTLQAHAIFTTARSLRSLDTSSVCSDDSVDTNGKRTHPSADPSGQRQHSAASGAAATLGERGGGGDGATAFATSVTDTAEVKILLLQALMATLPLPVTHNTASTSSSSGPSTSSAKVMDSGLTQEPAPILAAEVLSMPTTGLSPQQEILRSSCLQLLARIALREEGKIDADGTRRATQHVFLAATGAKLAQLLAGGPQTSVAACTNAAHLMNAAAEYVALVEAPSAAIAAAHHCLGPAALALGALQAGGSKPVKWDAAGWELLHGLLVLLAPVMAHCTDAEAGRSFIVVVLGDYKAASMLVAVADLVLLRFEEPLATQLAISRTKFMSLQRDLLTFFTALAGLLARQPALRGISSASDPGLDALVIVEPIGRGQRRKLTRRHALNYFSFLVCPNSEFVRHVLDHAGPNATNTGSIDGAPAPPAPPTTAAVRLRPALFDLLKTLFAAPGSPFIADKIVADHCVRFHFIQFLKLYHNPDRDHQAIFLCRQHMAVLVALAGSSAPHVRHRFQQLSVIDFFVRELSLEFEASQPNGSRLGPSEGSTGDLLAASRGGSSGKLHSSNLKKNSPASSSLDMTTPLGSTLHQSSHHKRGRSQSGVPMLPLTEKGSPWTTPSPTVPKLRLPGSGPRTSIDSEMKTPTAGEDTSPRHLSVNNRGASSRLGRDAAAQAAQAAASGSRVPALGISSAHSYNEEDDDDDEDDNASQGPPPTSSTDSDEEDDDRISSAVAALPVPLLELPRGQAPLERAGPSRPLDRVISAAISLDRGWLPSARTAAAASEASASNEGGQRRRRSTSGDASEEKALPSGFVFSGDLDEDVELLEALERAEDDSEETSSRSTTSSDDDGDDDYEAQSNQSNSRSPAALGLNLSRLASPDQGGGGGGESLGPVPELSTAVFTSKVPPLAATQVPRLTGLPLKRPDGDDDGGGGAGNATQLPDSPPPRPVPPPVPLLALTPSMHSTLEARMASAELQVALEAERSRRKAGRSFFGDLERSALGKGKMQAATLARPNSRSSIEHHHGVGGGGGNGLSLSLGGSNQQLYGGGGGGGGGFNTPGGGVNSSAAAAGGGGFEMVSYSEERGRRLVYRDSDLHLQVLVLIFNLILDPRGQLDPGYCDQYPWDRKLQNIPFVLHHHLNHPENREILPRLLPALHALGAPAFRLLRTLCAAFFRSSWYTQRTRISGVAGAYATVYRCALPAWAGDTSVVLKLLDTPKHIQDRCAQVDFHSEVTILDTLAGRPSACKMFDFGLDPGADALLLVLKDYRCSLKQWRAVQPADPATQLRLYYAVFREVVVAVGELLDAGVIHFDLKCDNILLEPLPGHSEAEFWAPSSAKPPFKVVLADFGESKLADGNAGIGTDASAAAVAALAAVAASGATTSRARGTDAFKSPEMLLVGGAVHKGHRAYDRRRRQGAGAASDVWSLGCLLYELVTGKLLFSDTDWLQLVARVTSTNMQLITDDRAASVADLPGVLDLLQYILVRDPALRPTLKDTLAKLDMALALHGHSLPEHKQTRSVLPPHLLQISNARVGMAGGSTGNDMMNYGEEPLPLVSALPLMPGLVLGPTSAVNRTCLRDAGVGRVVVISDRCDGSAGELLVPDILADEVLSGCLEAAAGVGATCEVVGGPLDGTSASNDAKKMLKWVEAALPRLQITSGASSLISPSSSSGQGIDQGVEGVDNERRRKVLLAAQPGREGAAALLAVAHAVRVGNCSPYRAMVRASHWGVDLYMTRQHLDVLKLFGEKEAKGR